MDLSRFEGDFRSAGYARLSKAELRDLLSANPAGSGRHGAIACYLSSSEGWDEALKALRGAFASEAASAVRSSRCGQDKHEINQRASEYLQWPALKPGDSDND